MAEEPFPPMLMSARAASPSDYVTAKSGPWTDTDTWVKHVVPPIDAFIMVTAGVDLKLDTTVRVGGLTIAQGGTLTFAKAKTVGISSNANISVLGKLCMKPKDATITHTIKFTGIDESKFVGGGMDIIDSDVGLWVRGAGQVDLQGSAKTAWTRATGSFSKGNKTISCIRPPTGWQIGDEISIAPTTPTTVSTFTTGFDVRKITQISGSTITLDSGLVYDHPKVIDPFSGKTFTAEILNLTRNVRIEGTGDGTANPATNGRAHINIGMVTAMSNIKYIQIRHMAPRKKNTTDAYTTDHLGRYGLHLHHDEDGLKGMIIEGVVARDCGGHAFVSHNTNDITFLNDISYSTFDEAYWWDVPTTQQDTVNNSSGVHYDSSIAALVRCDPPFRGYRFCGFHMGSGFRNSCTNCVVIGNLCGPASAGYVWPESSNYTPNTWIFTGNIAHNNKYDGIFTWENDSGYHDISDFLAYRNGGHGIEHGAYVNAFKYFDITTFDNKGNSIFLYSNPNANGKLDSSGYLVSFRRIYSTETVYIAPHTLVGKGSTLFKDCRFPGVVVSELPRRPGMVAPPKAQLDFVGCDLGPGNFDIVGMEVGSRIRVQDGQNAFQINDKGEISVIPLFFDYANNKLKIP